MSDHLVANCLLDHIKQLAERAGLTVRDGLVGRTSHSLSQYSQRSLTVSREGHLGPEGAQLHTHVPGGRRTPQKVEFYVGEENNLSISWLMPTGQGGPYSMPWFDKDSWRYDKVQILVPLADPKLIDKALGRINEALGTGIKDG